MAVDVSKSAADLFSGKKQTRFVPTLLIALLVTAAVSIPLVLAAVDARENPTEPAIVLAPADAQLIMVDTAATDPAPLDLAVVSGALLISLRQDDATAVSFNLFAAGADQPIVESLDAQGPQFDMVVSDSGGGRPFDSTLLQNGQYELFVTVRTPSEDRRTAVGFEIANP